tara:strand:- start:55 stop:654 length:600 start_codon:yes stop_codon:yes gene_type:complete
MSKTQIPTGGIEDNAIVTGKITDGTIATADIADSAVTSAKASGLGGLTMVDMWRLTTAYTNSGNSNNILSSNWERVDTEFDKIGTGMTESSGVFTFPSTGIYKVEFRTAARVTGSTNWAGSRIKISTDGSAPSATRAYAFNSGHTNGANAHAANAIIIDVTNASNYKVAFYVDSADTTYFDGVTNVNYTTAVFMKLGDT